MIYKSFQLIRINPIGGVIIIAAGTSLPGFQLIRINPIGGGSTVIANSLVVSESFQLIRINPIGGGQTKNHQKVHSKFSTNPN